MADDSGYGAGYGSYMNFFLPKSAQVGGPSLVPSPSLYDLLPGNLGSSMAGSPAGTPDEQKKQQEQQKQMLGMAQQGIKMMQPRPPTQPPPQPIPVTSPPPPQPMPQGTQVAPDQPPPPPVPAQAGMARDPRDPRNRNPLAGMPTPFGGFYR